MEPLNEPSSILEKDLSILSIGPKIQTLFGQAQKRGQKFKSLSEVLTEPGPVGNRVGNSQSDSLGE
jgi:hypothetical protein